MSTPIGDQAASHLIRHGVLTAEAIERVWHELTNPIRHHEPNAHNTAQPKGTTHVSMLDTAIAKVEDLAAHLKTVAENDVPRLEALQSSKIVQAIEGFVLSPEAETFIADMVGVLASKYGQPAAAPAAVDPAAADPAAAQPAA